MTIFFFFAFFAVEVMGGGLDRSGLEVGSKDSTSGAQTTKSSSDNGSGSSGSESDGSRPDFLVDRVERRVCV